MFFTPNMKIPNKNNKSTHQKISKNPSPPPRNNETAKKSIQNPYSKK